MDNVPLMQKFPKLFFISLYIGRTLSQVGIWKYNRLLWKLSWRKAFFV